VNHQDRNQADNRNGRSASLAVKKAATSIPLVMVGVGDPVATGLVASLGRPGGNISGLTSIVSEMQGKRLELLRGVVPKLSHVAVLWNATSPIRGPRPRLLGRIRQRDPRTGACNIGEAMNSEWVASANKQGGATIPRHGPLAKRHHGGARTATGLLSGRSIVAPISRLALRGVAPSGMDSARPWQGRDLAPRISWRHE
jgi:hypothetical protein